MKETPEAQAFDNAIIIGVNPKRVSIKPKMRPELRANMIFRFFIIGNNLTEY
jgi:hypothetical protein